MILLDTHILIWAWWEDDQLGKQAAATVDAAWRAGDAAVSAITFWELTMLQAKSRLTLTSDIASLRRQWLRSGLREIPLDGEIGVRAGLLADFHGDPADWIIVAAAQEGHQLMNIAARAPSQTFSAVAFTLLQGRVFQCPPENVTQTCSPSFPAGLRTSILYLVSPKASPVRNFPGRDGPRIPKQTPLVREQTTS